MRRTGLPLLIALGAVISGLSLAWLTHGEMDVARSPRKAPAPAGARLQVSDEESGSKASADAFGEGRERRHWVTRFPRRPATRTVLVNGRVMTVEAEGARATISLGEEVRVARGQKFIVYRGVSYVATVRVQEVRSEDATVELIEDLSKSSIRVGDEVTEDAG